MGLVRKGALLGILGGLLLLVTTVFGALETLGYYSLNTALAENAGLLAAIFALGLPLFAVGLGLALWGLADAAEE